MSLSWYLTTSLLFDQAEALMCLAASQRWSCRAKPCDHTGTVKHLIYCNSNPLGLTEHSHYYYLIHKRKMFSIWKVQSMVSRIAAAVRGNMMEGGGGVPGCPCMTSSVSIQARLKPAERDRNAGWKIAVRGRAVKEALEEEGRNQGEKVTRCAAYWWCGLR